jgi:hypothetical protein
MLEALRERGVHPREEEFVENYGLYAADEGRIPSDRHFRCTRGHALFDEADVEMLTFPSSDESREFLALVADEGGWIRKQRVLIRMTGSDTPWCERIETEIRRVLESK